MTANVPHWTEPILQKLGIHTLRPHQHRFVSLLESGDDFCVVLPTGYGKSLCFTIAPYLKYPVLGRVIVIIPLVRLGKQQASSLSNVSDHATRLKRSGLAAVFTDKKDELVKAIKDESVLYIFLSPELASSHLLDLLLDLPSADNDRFTHIFVDESHCVVKWGQSRGKGSVFRKEYNQIGNLRAAIPKAIMVALTATAPPALLAGVQKSLNMSSECPVIRISPNKANIKYCLRRLKSDGLLEAFGPLVESVQSAPEKAEKVLIFCRQLKHIGQIYCFLNARLPPGCVQMYHRKVKETIQDSIVNDFMSDTSSLRVIVCSSSFSMGMDLPGLCNVYHYGMPSTLDDYVQEVGRIGRSGEQSYAVLLVHKDSNKGANMSQECKDYSMTAGCLRTKIMHYFSEEKTPQSPDTCCSPCHMSAMSWGQCDHDGIACQCVKWSISDKSMISPLDSTPCQTESLKLIVRDPIPDLQAFRAELQKLSSDKSSFLPDHVSSQIYPELLDNVMLNHQYCASVADIQSLGTFSSNTATTIYSILDSFSPRYSHVDAESHRFSVDIAVEFSDEDDDC